MSSPTYNVFDGDVANGIPPRIPSLADLGGAQFVDDLEFPPDGVTFPTASVENQNEYVLAGVARTATVLNFSVKFVSGVPTLSGLERAGTTLLSSDITLTDNGNGDTTISWPASKIAARECGPTMSLNEDVEVDRWRVIKVSETSLRVVTKLGAVGTDCAFTVRW